MKDLIPRYHHLLWNIFPKHLETVENHRIRYVVVPNYFLIGGCESKSRFVNATCVTHRPTKSLMILISTTKSQDPLLKYTLLHEHLEGMAFLDFPLLDFDRDWANAAFDTALREIEKDVTDIEERVMSTIKRKRGTDREHFFALIVELAQMKKELGSSLYRQELEYALRKRF